jgi:hypothetical protein
MFLAILYRDQPNQAQGRTKLRVALNRGRTKSKLDCISDSDNSLDRTIQETHRKFISSRDYIRYRLAIRKYEE